MNYFGSHDDFMGNYPPGAANDPNAPWNQKDVPEVEVERKFIVEMECVASITTDDYFPNGDGYDLDPDFSQTDFQKEFENQYHSIPQLLGMLKERIEAEMCLLPEKSRKRRKLKELADECDMWYIVNSDNDEP